MKLIITETQLKKIRLITEGQEVVHTYLTKADDIKEKINRLYSQLVFSTFAEIIDGDIDLDTMSNKLENLRKTLYTHFRKGEMFFSDMGSDVFHSDSKWDTLQQKLKDTHQEVYLDKSDVLSGLLTNLSKIVKKNVESSFKDTKKLDI